MRGGIQFVIASLMAAACMQSHVANGAPLDAGPLDAVSWQINLNKAFDIARRENRPLVLHFWTPDCVPCKRLDRNVFSRKSVAEALHDFFVPVKINAALYPSIAAKYRVNRFPTDVIVSPADEELHRMISPQSPQQYVAQLSAIAFRSGLVPRNGNEKLDRGFGNSSLAGTNYEQQSTNITQTQYTAGQAPESQPRETANPYYGGNTQGSLRTAQNDRPPSGNVSQRYDGRNPYVNNSPAANQGNRPPAESDGNDRRDDTFEHVRYGESVYPNRPDPRQPTNRGGSPRLSMDGFCPVTLLQKDAWKKGDPRFGVIHRGRTYLFAGEKEKNIFLSNPDNFSPVLAGIDPVQLVSTGTVLEGNRAHGVVYRKCVYLFSSEENLQKFWNAPDRFTGTIEQAMSGGRRFR